MPASPAPSRFSLASGSPLLVGALLALAGTGCAAKRQAQWNSVPARPAAAEPSASEDAPTPAALMAAAEDFWARRLDEAALREAIALWEKAAALDPEDPAPYDRLARAWYFLGDAHARKLGPQGYLPVFETCIGAGERALAVSSPAFKQAVTSGKAVEEAIDLIEAPGVPGAYWYAACLGKWARAKGFATTLANKDRVKKVMERVLALAPDFFHGAPDRYFGAYYAVAPGFAGGDMDKSRDHFERSLQRAPYYAATKILMAEVYAAKKKDRALFDRLIAEVLAQDPDAHPELGPEIRVEQDKARELRARAEELF